MTYFAWNVIIDCLDLWDIYGQSGPSFFALIDIYKIPRYDIEA
jgi:hypothetical protein